MNYCKHNYIHITVYYCLSEQLEKLLLRFELDHTVAGAAIDTMEKVNEATHISNVYIIYTAYFTILLLRTYMYIVCTYVDYQV